MSDMAKLAKHLLNKQKAKMGVYKAANAPMAHGQSVPKLNGKAARILETPILDSSHHPQVFDAFLNHLKKAMPRDE